MCAPNIFVLEGCFGGLSRLAFVCTDRQIETREVNTRCSLKGSKRPSYSNCLESWNDGYVQAWHWADNCSKAGWLLVCTVGDGLVRTGMGSSGEIHDHFIYTLVLLIAFLDHVQSLSLCEGC